MVSEKSLQNLRKFTKENASEKGKKGAAKSAQVRRERKQITKDLQDMLAKTVTSTKAKRTLEESFGIKKGNYQQLLLAVQIVKAITEKDTYAFNSLVGILEKPQTKQSKEEAMGDVLDNMRMALEDAGDE